MGYMYPGVPWGIRRGIPRGYPRGYPGAPPSSSIVYKTHVGRGKNSGSPREFPPEASLGGSVRLASRGDGGGRFRFVAWGFL